MNVNPMEITQISDEIVEDHAPVIGPSTSYVVEVDHYMSDKLYKAAANFQGADIPSDMDDMESLHGLTPGNKNNILHVAAQCGNLRFITTMLDRVSISLQYKLLCKQNSEGETPLHLAAQFGDMRTIETLLFVHDKYHSAPMLINPKKKKIPCWSARDDQGNTPLHTALRYGHEDIAMLLLQRDMPFLVSLDNNEGESPAYLAAYYFCMGFLITILDADRDGKCCVSFSGPFGQTVFHPARKLTGDIMSKLIERRKNLLKVRDTKGKIVLHYAVEEKRDSMVEILLKADNTLAYVHDKDGLTPLHKASSMGLLSMIEIILELSPQSILIRDRRHGQTALHVIKMDACLLDECLKNTRMKKLINEVDGDGNTPLHLALINSDQHTADKLLEVHGIHWNLRNNQGYTPMDLCTSNDKILLKLKGLARAMIKERMNMTTFFHKDVVDVGDALNHCTWDWEEYSTYQGPERDSIFHIAAREGNMKVIESTSDHLLLLLARNIIGETPLHLAAQHGHVKVVRYILSLVPTPVDGSASLAVTIGIKHGDQMVMPWRMKSNNGDTPAHKAVKNRHVTIALELLQMDHELASFGNNADESLLYLSAENGCYDVLRYILLKDQEYITSGRGGENVLHAAARTSRLSTCKNLMVKKPYLLTEPDINGKTPLHYAAEYNMAKNIQLLLKQDKSAAFAYDNEGRTPLLRAASLGYFKSVIAILDLCPHSAELRDLSNNRTFIHLIKVGEWRSLNVLMKSVGMQILLNEADDDGNTALHCAILDLDAMKALSLLETKGIDWRMQNKQHQTPTGLCRELMRSGEVEESRLSIVSIRLSRYEVGEWSNSIAQKLILYLKTQRFLRYHKMLISGENTCRKVVDNVAVAAALLLTITSVAAFTFLGGYDRNTGDTMGIKQHTIKVFLFADVFAMFICASILIRYTLPRRSQHLKKLAVDSICLFQHSLIAAVVSSLSVVSFLSGAYAVGVPFKFLTIVPVIFAIIWHFIFHFAV